MPVSPNLPPDQLLDPEQVAVLLNVDPRTVARWAEAGKLAPVTGRSGQRRFARGDVLRLMVDIKQVQKRSASRPPGSPSTRTAKRTYAVAMAEAALEVQLTAGAVETAAVLASDAAVHARLGREVAGREADRVVAQEAAQNAVATRFRADAAAARVHDAAAQAATTARSSPGRDDPLALQRALRMAATVEAAATAMAEETCALAASVARAVAVTADLVAATRLTLERAIAAEVAATAVAVELRAMATAHVVAVDVAARLHRPETKNHP